MKDKKQWVKSFAVNECFSQQNGERTFVPYKDMAKLDSPKNSEEKKNIYTSASVVLIVEIFP